MHKLFLVFDLNFAVKIILVYEKYMLIITYQSFTPNDIASIIFNKKIQSIEIISKQAVF